MKKSLLLATLLAAALVACGKKRSSGSCRCTCTRRCTRTRC